MSAAGKSDLGWRWCPCHALIYRPRRRGQGRINNEGGGETGAWVMGSFDATTALVCWAAVDRDATPGGRVLIYLFCLAQTTTGMTRSWHMIVYIRVCACSVGYLV